MLFTSLDFAIFLPIVFALYWLMDQLGYRWQNLVVVCASYVFYGWWDWRFLSLILFSTLVDFSVGRLLGKEERESRRRLLLGVSLMVNLGLLGFFKYFNFFAENFAAAFSLFGTGFHATSLQVILPVGISFYTFQTMSYTIDVYRRKLEPTGDLIAFTAFVSFFPQLVAGPIERATNLLPQFYGRRYLSYEASADGLRQILWGLFKKMVIADNCAVYVDMIFNQSADQSGSTLLLGAFFFAFQIYGDFSGYSDIAIGLSRLFGLNLCQNFAYPYFSRDIAEFWRRWHMSLSNWFRDYLYIPLGGSRGGTAMKVRNTFIIFIVSGFWHGANWTFIVWGLLNALYFLPLLLARQNRRHLEVVASGRALPSLREVGQIAFTFLLTVLAWVFFRAETVGQAIGILAEIGSISLFTVPDVNKASLSLVFMLGVFIGIEWLGREHAYAIANWRSLPSRPVRWSLYCFIIFLIGMYAQTEETPFIYFQF